MTTFRILNQDPVYFELDGITPAAGGNLSFYESGTTTPKDVYDDPAMSVNNGPTVLLGADGRAVDDIWGEGDYRVRVYAFDATLISEADDVQIEGGSGTSIPALAPGEFLTNDGSVLAWAPVSQLPDPTGSSGKILGTDGTNFIFQAAPTNGAPGTNAAVTVTTTTALVGDGVAGHDLFFVQTGSGTIPASGASHAQSTVTFPTAFKACMVAIPTVTSTGDSILGPSTIGAINLSATGFTAYASVSAHGGGSDHDQFIINNVTFNWIAIGTKAG